MIWPFGSRARKPRRAPERPSVLSLDGQAMGFAVVKDGLMDVRTVNDCKQGAILNGIMASGHMVMIHPDAPAAVYDQAFAHFCPSAKVVEVKVEVLT